MITQLLNHIAVTTAANEVVKESMLNTICQLECELDLREGNLRRAKANMVRWAKRYRRVVVAHMQRRYNA